MKIASAKKRPRNDTFIKVSDIQFNIMSKLYILNFENSLGPNKAVTDHLNSDPENIVDWYSCMSNTIFVATNLSAQGLAEFVKKMDHSQHARFFVMEINSNILYWGWMPDGAWDFVKKYV